ncbi:MAG TPA: enhanced serine sensitivity protein SseB C-terminal domain-containing protein [Candidatus Acidoferrum sp.]|nr:enhanced serine sensitivity protein SseB C-terminal domain-containing protein [Candidatus Acidoferrum sp.]
MSFFQNMFGGEKAPENPELERAMHELARSDNAETRARLYKAILSSTFIFQGTVTGGEERDGKTIADGNTRVALQTVEHPPGNVVLPVFTSVEALGDWAGPGGQWIATAAQVVFQSIAAGNIAEVRVNPLRPGQAIRRPGGVITRREFLALAQGLLPEAQISDNTTQMKLAAGQRVLIGTPANMPPAAFLKKVTDYFQPMPEVRGAYLFQIARGKMTSRVIGLHFASRPDEQRMQEIMRGVGDAIRGELPTHEAMDFLALENGPLLDGVRTDGVTLFRK